MLPPYLCDPGFTLLLSALITNSIISFAQFIAKPPSHTLILLLSNTFGSNRSFNTSNFINEETDLSLQTSTNLSGFNFPINDGS